ncbi:hypothetical protein CH298_26920 [Rhodococcoides fascians]|uniref:hypothetical protein n=1 Tax=Rhodococcoides fascians TaxID=1828 RepID=UPI000B9A7139|nr:MULTISPECIES: hypothetical protein [Rhodococcus]OZD68927.1 hypothetical protein CH263_08500 [Rhodococcus sp. 06-1059B-a]OZE81393.1 hypothetical protein CH303_27460 [Rhodococcus fascians]OZF10217.1 hypothetical protein CH298_26920 [Rhodococcus fascians]OZF13307.1 hypothetical protein CH297_27210 [Rhodococcus fascians]OZF59405.1 hypothetical protein CH308_27660 [Rhodococcus fascians]
MGHGRHRLLTEPQIETKPAHRLHGGDIGGQVRFVPLRWTDTAITGELRQIRMSADEIHIAVLQTDQQKGAYPVFESSGMDDAPYFVDYEIDWGVSVDVCDR